MGFLSARWESSFMVTRVSSAAMKSTSDRTCAALGERSPGCRWGCPHATFTHSFTFSHRFSVVLLRSRPPLDEERSLHLQKGFAPSSLTEEEPGPTTTAAGQTAPAWVPNPADEAR